MTRPLSKGHRGSPRNINVSCVFLLFQPINAHNLLLPIVIHLCHWASKSTFDDPPSMGQRENLRDRFFYLVENSFDGNKLAMMRQLVNNQLVQLVMSRGNYLNMISRFPTPIFPPKNPQLLIYLIPSSSSSSSSSTSLSPSSPSLSSSSPC